MRADEQEEARNGSPKLQRAGLPVCTVPSLQVDDLNCDHRDPAQVLLYLRALRRELRAAFFPGAVSGAPVETRMGRDSHVNQDSHLTDMTVSTHTSLNTPVNDPPRSACATTVRRVCRGFLRRLLMPGNSSKKTAKHATRATTSAPAARTAGATDPPSGEPEVADGNETFATPQDQGIGRQAGVTEGKIDQPEDSAIRRQSASSTVGWFSSSRRGFKGSKTALAKTLDPVDDVYYYICDPVRFSSFLCARLRTTFRRAQPRIASVLRHRRGSTTIHQRPGQ